MGLLTENRKTSGVHAFIPAGAYSFEVCSSGQGPSKDPKKTSQICSFLRHAQLISSKTGLLSTTVQAEQHPSANNSLPSSTWWQYILVMARSSTALCYEVMVSSILCFIFIEITQEKFSVGVISHFVLVGRLLERNLEQASPVCHRKAAGR